MTDWVRRCFNFVVNEVSRTATRLGISEEEVIRRTNVKDLAEVLMMTFPTITLNSTYKSTHSL